MRRSSPNPLPVAFVPFPTSPESPALAAYYFAQAYRAQMEAQARAISPEAHAALLRQWPGLFDNVLLNCTRDWLAALRAGFKGYRGLN